MRDPMTLKSLRKRSWRGEWVSELYKMIVLNIVNGGLHYPIVKKDRNHSGTMQEQPTHGSIIFNCLNLGIIVHDDNNFEDRSRQTVISICMSATFGVRCK